MNDDAIAVGTLKVLNMLMQIKVENNDIRYATKATLIIDAS